MGFIKNFWNNLRGKKQDIIVEIIDGRKVRTFMLSDEAIDGNEIQVTKDVSYIFNEDMVLHEGKQKVIHLIKDVPCAVNHNQLQKIMKDNKYNMVVDKKNKKGKITHKLMSNFGQLDYDRLKGIKSIKNIDSRVLKKVLVTRFLSNILDEGGKLPEWLIPAVTVANLILTVMIGLRVYGIGVKG